MTKYFFAFVLLVSGASGFASSPWDHFAGDAKNFPQEVRLAMIHALVLGPSALSAAELAVLKVSQEGDVAMIEPREGSDFRFQFKFPAIGQKSAFKSERGILLNAFVAAELDPDSYAAPLDQYEVWGQRSLIFQLLERAPGEMEQSMARAAKVMVQKALRWNSALALYFRLLSVTSRFSLKLHQPISLTEKVVEEIAKELPGADQDSQVMDFLIVTMAGLFPAEVDPLLIWDLNRYGHTSFVLGRFLQLKPLLIRLDASKTLALAAHGVGANQELQTLAKVIQPQIRQMLDWIVSHEGKAPNKFESSYAESFLEQDRRLRSAIVESAYFLNLVKLDPCSYFLSGEAPRGSM